MDLFGRERARLRQELAELDEKHKRTSARAAERQDKIAELERLIEDLKGEVLSRRQRKAPRDEIDAAERALQEAQATHSRSTR